MKKIYAIRVKFKDGRNEILKFDKHMIKRNMKVSRLKQDKSIEEVVPIEIWE